MKKILVLLVFMLLLTAFVNAQQSHAVSYAVKVANRMKDKLSLTEEQTNKIYSINLQISERKANVWQKYSGSDSLIAVNLQRIESSRDSLYKKILGLQKFEFYKTRKQVILSNN